MSQERTQLIDIIMRAMPICDRNALIGMSMEKLEDLRRGYRLREIPEPVVHRPSELERITCPLTCHTCNQKWSMPLYVHVATTVWCPHCGIELETMTEEEMG